MEHLKGYLPTDLVRQYRYPDNRNILQNQNFLGYSYQTEVLSPFMVNLCSLNNTPVIADIGGGVGELQRISREYYPHVSVITCDTSKAALKAVESNPVLARGELLPFADKSLDAIHCKDMLMHIRNKEAFLTEIFRILKPGGIALISSATMVVNSFAYSRGDYRNWSFFLGNNYYLRRASALEAKGYYVAMPYFRTNEKQIQNLARRVGYRESSLISTTWNPSYEEKDWYQDQTRFVFSLVKPRL